MSSCALPPRRLHRLTANGSTWRRRDRPSADRWLPAPARPGGFPFFTPRFSSRSGTTAGSRHRLGWVVADFHHAILLIDVDHVRLHCPGLFVGDYGVAHDDHQVAGMDEMRRRAVDSDHAGSARPGDYIGFYD